MNDVISISLGGVASEVNVEIALPVIGGGGGIPDAPEDGETYGRRNKAWEPLSDVAASGNYGDLGNLPDLSGFADKIYISGATEPTKQILPNLLYVWGEVAALDITLASPPDITVLNEYMFQFTSGATATTLTLPASVVFGAEVSINANKTYQVSIVNNLGVIGEF